MGKPNSNGIQFAVIASLPTAAAGNANTVLGNAGLLWYSNGNEWVPIARLAREKARVATAGSINTTEGYLQNTAQFPVPANTLYAGACFRITAYGICTSTNADTVSWTMRLGTAGTVADTAVIVGTSTAATGSNISFKVELMLTIQTIGASGTCTAAVAMMNNGVTGMSNAVNVVFGNGSTITIDTTVKNFLGASLKTSATTTTLNVRQCVVEQIA